MSTRAVIARTTGDVSTVTGQPHWEGRHHHWDGYPSGLGKRLYELAHHFNDLAWMLTFLIDQHPAGWSTILACDIDAAPGYRELGCQHPGEPDRHNEFEAHMTWERTQGPQCYCHGDRREAADPLITDNSANDWDTEWAYVINPATGVMTIYERIYEGDTPIYHRAVMRWSQVATVDLYGPEPDWRAMEGHAK